MSERHRRVRVCVRERERMKERHRRGWAIRVCVRERMRERHRRGWTIRV